MSSSKPKLVAASERLRNAAATGLPCQPVRDLIGSTDIATAYAVQALGTQARCAAGAEVSGRKIGLTSTAVQQQIGVDQPDFGYLFEDMRYDDGAVIPMRRLMQPKVEAEVAFGLRKDLSGEIGEQQVRDAVDFVAPALEIVDSRIADWDITFGDTVADNGSSGLYVLGKPRGGLDEIEPVEVQMTMTRNGASVSHGTGADCLGDPLHAVLWLARTSSEFGDPLRAGQVILSGALGPMSTVSRGDSVVATLTGLGSVSTTFSKE